MPTSEKVAQHTPGPWEAEQRRDNTVRIVDEQEVTVAVAYQQPADTWTVEANARLIAAAPLLLQTLEDVIAEFNDMLARRCPDAELVAALDGLLDQAGAIADKARGA